MEKRIYSILMTEEELRLFSEFLEQRENSAVDGILTPASLEPVSAPALGGPNKGVLGVIEKAAPRVLMKMASDQESSKINGPSERGKRLMRVRKSKLIQSINKGSFKGIGH
jgi:hypothetical protein